MFSNFQDHCKEVRYRTDWSGPTNVTWMPNIALLRACKGISDEASPIFYGSNEFIFEESIASGSFSEDVNLKRKSNQHRQLAIRIPAQVTALHFLKKRSQTVRNQIKTLQLDIDHWCREPFKDDIFDFTASYIGLKNLSLNFHALGVNTKSLPWMFSNHHNRIRNSSEIWPLLNAHHVYSLCKLRGLTNLNLNFTGSYPLTTGEAEIRLKEQVRFAFLLCSKMLCHEAGQARIPREDQMLISSYSVTGEYLLWHLHFRAGEFNRLTWKDCPGNASVDSLEYLWTGDLDSSNAELQFGERKTHNLRAMPTPPPPPVCPVCHSSVTSGNGTGVFTTAAVVQKVVKYPQSVQYASWPDQFADEEF